LKGKKPSIFRRNQVEDTSQIEGTPKRFRELIKETNPSAETLNLMRGYLRTLITNIRYKFGWFPRNPKKISSGELAEQEDDAINETIAVLMNKYRAQVMSSHVTENAAYQVLNMVRNWVRRRYFQLKREEPRSDEDLANFAEGVFHPSAENRFELFERLYKLRVIDLAEFYFLFASYRRLRNIDAVELLNADVPEEMAMEAATGRSILRRARANVQNYLKSPDGDKTTPVPRATSAEMDPRRKIDFDRLMSAFRFLCVHSV
jgi:hypothetical protein